MRSFAFLDIRVVAFMPSCPDRWNNKQFACQVSEKTITRLRAGYLSHFHPWRLAPGRATAGTPDGTIRVTVGHFGARPSTWTEEPVVAEPVVAEPVVAEPVVAEPVVAEPVVAEPVVAEPVVAVPPAAWPAGTSLVSAGRRAAGHGARYPAGTRRPARKSGRRPGRR